MIVKLEYSTGGFCFVNPEQVVNVSDDRSPGNGPSTASLVLSTGFTIKVRGHGEQVARLLADGLQKMRQSSGHLGKGS